MKKVWTFVAAIFLFCACNDDEAKNSGENDLDAARMFIRDVLDGKFDKARQLMIPDSTNENRMADTERNYEHMKGEERRGYRESSITIHDTRKANDSTTIVQYSNTFYKIRDSVKVIRRNGKWLVDLKYTFEKTLPENDR